MKSDKVILSKCRKYYHNGEACLNYSDVLAVVRKLTKKEKPAEDPLEKILKNVSEKTLIPVWLLKSDSRIKEIVFARKCYYMEAKRYTKDSLAKIGKAVGKDHATVLHGINDMNTTFGLLLEYEYVMGYKIRPVIPFPKPFKAIENKAILIGQSPLKVVPEPIKRESKYKDIPSANNQPFHGYRVHQL